MKKYLHGLYGFIIGVAALGLAFVVSAQPGGADDPLVSRSYLNARLAEVQHLLNQAPAHNCATYVPIFLFAGQTLLGHEGSEIILRSGAGVGVAHENGLVNMTTGGEIFHNDPVSINHLLIVPRTDGRGVFATENSYFIVRGGFEIRN